MIPAVAGLIVRAVILLAAGSIIAAFITWLDREIGRGLSRKRD